MVANISNLSTQKTNLYADSGNTAAVVPIKPDTKEAPQYDSVNFSSKNKQEGFFQKHWGKLLLGAAAIATGIVLTKGKLWAKPQAQSMERIHQNLAEIFGKKDLTKEQAEAMLKKYHEILKIEDKDKFIDTAFNTIKEDFGYKDTKIKLEKSKSTIKGKTKVGNAAFNPTRIEIYTGLSKEQILISTAHEFCHLRQTEQMIRTGLYDEKFIEHGTSVLGKNRRKDIIEWLNEIKEDLGFHTKPKYEEKSPEYQKAKEYLKWAFDKNYEANYDKNAMEIESKHIGELMRQAITDISAMQ